MSRKLIIDGNAVYEIDEECMLKRRLNGKESREASQEKRRQKIRRIRIQRNKCEMKRARLCTDLALILCKKRCRTNYLICSLLGRQVK